MVWAEAPWLSYDEYVVVSRAGDTSESVPIAGLDGSGLLVRWANDHNLEIGFPVESDPAVRGSERGSIHYQMVPYPNVPAIHDKYKELLHLDPYPSSRRIDFVRRSDFINNLLDSATYQVPLSVASYQVSEASDAYTRTCRLSFSGDGGRVAQQISFALQAQIEKERDFVSFSVVLGVAGVRDVNLSRLALTGAQFVGDGLATSMTEARSFANGPAAVGEFTIYLFRDQDLQRLLVALGRPSFKLAFLWDLPDTVALSEVTGSPTGEQLAAFFQCVGNAKPTHLENEQFNPFYRIFAGTQ